MSLTGTDPNVAGLSPS